MTEIDPSQEEFSFKNYFVPFTTLKAIHWIIFIGLIVYANMLFNGFVLDDEYQILNNYIVHSIGNLPIFFLGGTFNNYGSSLLAGLYYRPVMLIYFSFLYSLFGSNPFFFHFLQLLLNLLNTSLIFILFNKFFPKKLSFFLSLIFLTHPVNQEAVSYISDIGTVLFFTFGISAILVIMSNMDLVKKTLISNIFFILSLLSYESAIVIAPLMIFSAWLHNKKEQFIISLSTIIILGVYLFFRFFLLDLNLNSSYLFPMFSLSLTQRLINIPAIIYYYLTTFIYPKNLEVVQIWTIDSINLKRFYFPLIIDILFFILIGFLGIYLYKTKSKNMRLYLFFLGFFILGLSPFLQIIPLELTVATRWFYFPFIGLLGLLGLSLDHIKIHKKNKLIVYILAAVIIFLLSVMTMIRNTDWYNNITLYSHDIKLGDNFVLETDLGNEYFTKGDYDQAFTYYLNSVKEKPNWSSLYDLGAVYYEKKEYSKAIIYFKQSLQYNNTSTNSSTYESLSKLYFFSGDINDAKKYSEKGLTKVPRDSFLWYIYALSEYQLGNREQAINAIQHSISIDNNTLWREILKAFMNNQKINFQMD